VAESDASRNAAPALQEPALGKAAGPASVTEGANGLEIVIPVRRSRLSMVMAVVFAVVAAIDVLRLALVITSALSGAEIADVPLLLGALGLGLLTMALSRVALLVMFGVVLYRVVGRTTVTVTRSSATVRKGIGRVRAYFTGLEFDGATVRTSAGQNPRGFWEVCLEPASGGRALLFGAGHLDRGQAEGISGAIARFVVGERADGADG